MNYEEALLDAERRFGSRGGHLLRRGLAAEQGDAELVIRLTERKLQDIYAALDAYAKDVAVGMHADAAAKLLVELQDDTGIGHVSEADLDAYCSPAEPA